MSPDIASRLSRYLEKSAVIFGDETFSFADILRHFNEALHFLKDAYPRGDVVLCSLQFSARSIGAFLAMMERGDVVILSLPSRFSIVKVHQHLLETTPLGFRISHFPKQTKCALVHNLNATGDPGLAFITSGTSGKPKIVLHSFLKISAVFDDNKKARIGYAFLPPDQIGGFYNLLYSLWNGGTIVSDPEKTPDRVALSIEKNGVQLLACNPSFMRILHLAEVKDRYDLSSLEQINFGTEPISEGTLKRIHADFPHVKLRQKFGMSEIGVIGGMVEAQDSPYLKLDKTACEYRVVDGVLEVKSRTIMLGYLQGGDGAPIVSADGWFRTGDLATQRGEFIHILGRCSDLINVGGRKVLAQEVEEILQDFPGLLDVVAEAEANALLGQIVRAIIYIDTKETPEQTRDRVRKFCRSKGVDTHKVPQKIIVRPASEWSASLKKQRRHLIDPDVL